MTNCDQRQGAKTQKRLCDPKTIWEEPARRTPRPLAEIRRDCEMSVSEVASAIGFGYAYYRQLELGKFLPSEKTKATLCQIFSCLANDIAWPTLGDVTTAGLKRWTFKAGQTYMFVPVSPQHGGAAKRGTVREKKRKMRYLRDAGVNHVFEDTKGGELECFIDAQLMDYAISEA